MDIILICRDALVNSLVGCVGTALAAKKGGADAGVIFTNEALAALGGIGAFRWSPLFEGRTVRAKICKSATAMGIEVADAKDSRWTDIPRLLKSAKDAGVKLYACPMWTNILGLNGALPSEVTVMDPETLLKEMQSAKTIIGGL